MPWCRRYGHRSKNQHLYRWLFKLQALPKPRIACIGPLALQLPAFWGAGCRLNIWIYKYVYIYICVYGYVIYDIWYLIYDIYIYGCMISIYCIYIYINIWTMDIYTHTCISELMDASQIVRWGCVPIVRYLVSLTLKEKQLQVQCPPLYTSAETTWATRQSDQSYHCHTLLRFFFALAYGNDRIRRCYDVWLKAWHHLLWCLGQKGGEMETAESHITKNPIWFATVVSITCVFLEGWSGCHETTLVVTFCGELEAMESRYTDGKLQERLATGLN